MKSIFCHSCGLLLRIVPMQNGQVAKCIRCRATITKVHTQAHRVILASTLSACVFLAASFYLPFLTLIAAGQSHQISLLDCVLAIAQFDFVLLAFVVFVFIVLVPATVTLLLLFLAASVQWWHKGTRLQGGALRGYSFLLPWSMADIFVVGCLVSLVKVLDLADVRIESGFYCYVLFVLFLLVAIYFTDKRQITEKLQLTNELDVHTNNTGGQATWALLITACLLYVPASVFPIMVTSHFGNSQPNTIVQGVITLWEHGSYPIALIIFIASVCIPVAKIVALCWLNAIARPATTKNKTHAMRVYRIVEIVGRWSMIDVFVVAILVALIHVGDVVRVYPGAAVLSFTGVVVVTMLAAISFDAKRIWK